MIVVIGSASKVHAATGDLAVIRHDEPRFESPWHHHAEAQLIYSLRGVVSVTTARGTWVVPPSRAVWVPAGVIHRTASQGAVAFRALLVETVSARGLPADCAVVEVTPLLRELILRVAEQDCPADVAALAARLILKELAFRPLEPLSLPMPAHAGLAAVCARLVAAPAEEMALEAAAAQAGLSRSGFIRRFRRETGLSFGRWRQQARLLSALMLLAEGRSVLSVSLDCGYDSPSAFAAMFRRTLGRPPSAYFAADPT